MGQSLKIAACQLDAELGNIPENLARSEKLVTDGFSRGARWVILPEFFPTACGFHPSMDGAARRIDGAALSLLLRAARRYQGFVGGSFLWERGDDCFNTFVLAKPDGTYETHDKDQPTMWENCYYRGGSDDGIFQADGHSVGAVLCWEFIRWRTARRLLGKVDLVVGGSGWWSYPDLPLLRTVMRRDDRISARINEKSFARMARVLGVPVVHAAHCGSFTCKTPALGLPYPGHFLGETQIVDGTGRILSRRTREEGPGVITAAIEPGPVETSEPIGEGFWTESLPWTLELSWRLMNAHGRRYYRKAHQRRESAR